MLKVLVGYPTSTEEFVIVERMTGALQTVQKILTTEQLLELQKEVDQVYVDPALDRVCRAHGDRHAQTEGSGLSGDWNDTSCLAPVRALRST